jgi:hypothetical protein
VVQLGCRQAPDEGLPIQMHASLQLILVLKELLSNLLQYAGSLIAHRLISCFDLCTDKPIHIRYVSLGYFMKSDTCIRVVNGVWI